jgi:hypothetical protein
MSRLVISTAVLAALLLTGAGCSEDGDPDPGTAATPPSATPSAVTPTPPPSPSPTPTVSDPEVACGDDPFDPKKVRPYDTGARPYAGNGVHLARLVHMHYTEDPYVTRLPRAWDGHLGSDGSRVELLICEHEDPTYRSRTVDTCRYEGSDGSKSTAKLLSARYRYRVFEAKTGRQITTFTRMGSLNGCPGIEPAGPSPEYYRRPADDDLAAKLRPFIVGPARRS